MNRTITILLALAMTVSAVQAQAQSYSGALGSNAWNKGSNVAGLRMDTSRHGSFAELSGSYVSGGFKSSSQPITAWTAGASAATLMHYGRYSLIGDFSFEQFRGQGMAGSMFMQAETYPFDLIEFTKGTKTRQKYSFRGGISVDMGDHWFIGADMRFLSGNYAKLKDLRHTNYRLEMTVSPGVAYKGDNFSFGLNYLFHRNTETVKAEQIGTGESSYYAFLDKGLEYGKYEVWTGGGTHLSDEGVNGFPVSEMSHGVGFQLSSGGFFAEMKYARSQGKAGEKQTIWFRFPGQSADLLAEYKIKGDKLSHSIALRGSWRSRTNYETVLEKVSNNGVTLVNEYGSNAIYTKEDLVISPSYNVSAGKLSIGLQGEYRHNDEIATLMYPYIYTQETTVFSGQLSLGYVLGHFNLGMTGGFSKGRFDPQQRMSSETSGVSTEPYKLESYWAGKMEFITTPQIRLIPSVRYGFSNGMYIAADGRFVRAFNLVIIPSGQRNTFNLRFGYNF